jgi:uncharacterized phage infection (PIP) family protein YhgE
MNKNGFQRLISEAIFLISIISIAIAGWFLFISPGLLRQQFFPPKPCAQPITYSIGSIDPRFGVSTSSLITALQKATALWSDAAGKPLFAYAEKGELQINLVYDERQSSTDKLKKLGYTISSDQASYNKLKEQLAEQKTLLDSKQADITKLKAEIEKKTTSYEQEVQTWNRRGGATPEAYQKLETERKNLNSQAQQLQTMVDAYNALVDQVNALVAVINRIASSLNLKVDQANAVTGGLSKEFEEGEYVSDQSGVRITIYEFDSPERLHRVLTHEFGHALGLEHVDDPKAIMYYLNKDQATALSSSDLQALRALCGQNK